MTKCPRCNDTGSDRYWESRWRDEKAENERLRAALEEIANPIMTMKKRAESEGGTLNWEMANQIATMPYHYQSIASCALEQKVDLGAGEK